MSERFTSATRGGGERPQRGFAVVAYGKLGGIPSSGYGSDLDLVFLHGGDPNSYTDGRKIAHRQPPVLPAPGPADPAAPVQHPHPVRDPLRDLDMRLRPHGDAGLLVSSPPPMSSIQQQEAWTWEHQAWCVRTSHLW